MQMVGRTFNAGNQMDLMLLTLVGKRKVKENPAVRQEAIAFLMTSLLDVNK